MRVLYRASAGFLWRHPWQLALALAGICVGVAAMVAVDLASGSSRTAFQRSLNAINGRTTHQIVGGPGGVDERLYVDLRVSGGVRQIAPVVSGYVELRGQAAQVVGVDVFAETGIRRYTRPGDDDAGIPVRALLTTPGAAVLSQRRAAELGIAVGEDFELTADGRTQTAVLVGMLDDPAVALDEVLVVDIATAQDWLDMPGRLSRIDAVLPGGRDAELALRAKLPDGVQLLPAARRSRSVTEMSNAFTTNLTAMSLLALLVGVFLIYNSVSFAVLQRRALLGILRALGVTRQEAFGLILREALALGVLGALLGIALGIWLGQQLLSLVSQSINDLYFRVSVTDVAVSGLSIAKGFLAGMAATLAAAAVPAFEAASYPPRLTLTRSVLEARSGAALSKLTWAGLALVTLGVLVFCVSGQSLVAGLSVLFLLVLGCSLWIPRLARCIARALAPAARRVAGSTARLAISGVAASLSRTGVAIVALAVAVSATIGVSVMVDSFRHSVSDWLDQTLRSDFYIAVAGGGDLDPALVDTLVTAPGVADHSSSRRVWLESEQGLTRLIALDMAPGSYAGTELLDATPGEVWPAFGKQGAVLVSETLAYRRHLERGDALFLDTARGRRAFTILATYRSYDANAGAVLMSRAIYDTFWNDDGIDSLGIYLADEADAAQVMQVLKDLADGRQSLRFRSNRELREQSLRIFDRTFIITDVLYWLAVVVAIIGILGAVLALQMERAREFAVLRALGMTPLQLGAMVTLQSGFIGVLSGLAAMPLGLLMAWLLIGVINRRAFGWSMQVDIDPAVLSTALGLSAGAAVLAGLYPAWRAARRSPAAAMREE